jgi:type VI secretion system secreted protein Hcp
MAIYMGYEGVKGNVTAAGYQGMIPLDFFVLRSHRKISMETGNLSNRESTVPKFGVMETGKRLDGSMIGIFKEILTGSAGKKVTVHFVRTGAQQFDEFLTLTFNNCLPTFYRMVGTDRENGVPAERLYLSYSAVEINAIARGADNKSLAPQRYAYDLATGQSR